MQLAAVVTIVILAAAYMLRDVVRPWVWPAAAGCATGCGSCPAATADAPVKAGRIPLA